MPLSTLFLGPVCHEADGQLPEVSHLLSLLSRVSHYDSLAEVSPPENS